MNRFAGLIAGAVLLTAAAGAGGAWFGVRHGMTRDPGGEASLDEVLHHRLHLSADQNTRIEALEGAFAARKTALEAQMTAANRELAAALTQEHTYGPAAEQAIGHFHLAMGELQEATVQHILAMRAVLTPEQAARFDQTLTQALAPAGR